MTNELKDLVADMTKDPLFRLIGGGENKEDSDLAELAQLLHEAKHDIDEGFDEGEGECNCCDYYAYSDGDSPEGDL